MSYWKPELAEQYARLIDDHVAEIAHAIFNDDSNPQAMLIIEQEMIGLVRQGIARAEWIGEELSRLNHGSGTTSEQDLDQLVLDLNKLTDLMISLRNEITDCPLFELRRELNGLIKSHILYR